MIMMHSMKFPRVLHVLLPLISCAVLGAGCSGSREMVNAGEAESQALLEQLRQSYAATPDLSVNGNLRVSGATIWFDALVRGRDSLRINLVGPFGVPVGALSATPDAFVFLNAQEGEAVEGRPSRENFAKLLMIDLEYDEMLSMLRGELPRFPAPGTYTARKSDDAIAYEVRTPGMVEKFSIALGDATLQSYARGTDVGGTIAEELAITYNDYRALGGRQFPRRGIVDIGAGQQKITISVERVSDRIDPDRSCAIDLPPGIDRRKL